MTGTSLITAACSGRGNYFLMGICQHSLAHPGQNPVAKVKLTSDWPVERTILSSKWEHRVHKSGIIVVLCTLALPHKSSFITEQEGAVGWVCVCVGSVSGFFS